MFLYAKSDNLILLLGKEVIFTLFLLTGTCMSIWFYSYASQIFYAIVFGSMSGAYVGLTSVVLVDLLGMERLTNAFGLLLMFQGIASVLGPPMCGKYYDRENLYAICMILTFICMCVFL